MNRNDRRVLLAISTLNLLGKPATQRQISRYSIVSLRTVVRAIKRLEKLGHITVNRSGPVNRYTTNGVGRNGQ